MAKRRQAVQSKQRGAGNPISGPLTNTPPDMSRGRGASRSIFLRDGFVDVSHAIHKLTRALQVVLRPLGGLAPQALARLAVGACSFLGFLQRV
jgi:hypothetical protein